MRTPIPKGLPVRERAPIEAGFFQPAEWAPHAAVWLAWPSHVELWQDSLPQAQREHIALCEAIHDGGRGERIRLLVRSDADEHAALRALPFASCVRAEYGDLWLRDTAPIFLVDGNGNVGSVRFVFNGWGAKYVLLGDAELASEIQRVLGPDHPAYSMPFVLEGGAVEVDGEGTVLSTRQCLLHPNRNPGMDAPSIERAVLDALGARTMLWLDEGLLHDHTDGHIDTIARFVAPGVVVCMAPSGEDDPNRGVLEAIARDLERMIDAKGRRLQVIRIPSPGRVLDEEASVMPASYVNFYVANTTVVVPTYGTRWDEAALRALEPVFPGRRVIGSSARTILEGGGAFHCITQQQPEGGAR